MADTLNIRFKGFTDAWEKNKLEEMCNEFKSGISILADNVCEEGNYPVYGGNGLRGYTSAYNHDGEYALIGRQGALCGNMNYSIGKAYFTEHAVAVQANEKAVTRFLYYLLDIMNLGQYSDQSAQPGLAVSKLIKLENVFPSKDEQEKIGDFFSNFDHLITLHQRKCDETKELKKYMLQKMFPQNGKKIPEIRFAGFTDDWEQCKFGELYEINNERNKELIGYDKTFSIATMTYKNEGNGAADSSLANYKVLRLGDIAFEGHTNKEFRYGRFVVNDVGDGIMSPRFSTLRPINRMPVSFWKYYIHYEPIMRNKLVCSTKAGTMMNELVVSDFFEQSIFVPQIEEQERIGGYLEGIDTLATLHQRKCDELKEVKIFMLQNMFPQKG